MKISHVGKSTIYTPYRNLKLLNILHVPQTTKNLVSVHRLALDNNMFLEFHPWFFLIKDRDTGSLLLKGKCRQGLYPLPAKFTFSVFRPSLTKWHDRMGHPAMQVV
jgi:hypothetical protein